MGGSKKEFHTNLKIRYFLTKFKDINDEQDFLLILMPFSRTTNTRLSPMNSSNLGQLFGWLLFFTTFGSKRLEISNSNFCRRGRDSQFLLLQARFSITFHANSFIFIIFCILTQNIYMEVCHHKPNHFKTNICKG